MNPCQIILHAARKGIRHFVHGIVLHAVRHPIAALTVACSVGAGGVMAILPPTTAPAYVAPPVPRAQPVPEPASIAVFGVGWAVLVGVRRVRRG